MTPSRAFNGVCWLMAVVGMAASLAAMALRYRAEMRNRSVEIVIDYAEVQRLATAAGASTADVLRQFREAGVISVAIEEETIADLVESGRASVNGDGHITAVHMADPALMDRTAREWSYRGAIATREIDPDDGPYTVLGSNDPKHAGRLFPSAYPALSRLGIGIPPVAADTALRAGLHVVARISNFPGADEATVEHVLRSCAGAGAQTVICTGTEILGNRGGTVGAAEAFMHTGLRFGLIEFGKQQGDERLAEALGGQFVRVHSISEGEMGALSEDAAIERFAKAARERNIRICYVRMLTFAGSDPIGANLHYISSIVDRMGKMGLLRPGPARFFEDPAVPRYWAPLMALLCAVLVVRASMALLPLRTPLAWAALLGTGAALMALAWSGPSGAKMVAFAAALATPTLACMPLVRLITSDGAETRTGSSLRDMFTGVGMLIQASAITACGLAPIVGLLASRAFMVKTDQFAGIKAAHAVPVVLVGLALIVGVASPAETIQTAIVRIRTRLQAFVRQPITIGAFALALAILAALMVAVVRTGNESGMGVSGFEMRFRSILDIALPARPRTKEFLIGHPAMVLAAAAALTRRRAWAAPLAVLGALGQVSILNTFCHIHTPLALSAARVLTGIILGAVIGVAIATLALRSRPGPSPPSG